MANWAWTNYVIEGSREALERILNAVINPVLEEGDSDGWEGGVLKALNIDLNKDKEYLRGFIQKDTIELTENTLSFSAEEAWGATDFHIILKRNIPDIIIYYEVEEPDDEVYATNDKKGKYFRDRFYVDCCIKGSYYSEYFIYKSDVFKWLHEITNGKINTDEKIEAFNSDSEELNEEDFIHIFEFDIVD